jgi:parallel beta-helix repeat protein
VHKEVALSVVLVLLLWLSPFVSTSSWNALAQVNTVHNVDTGLSYASIQEAINAPETLNGHTIFAEKGTYYEHVIVNKSLSIIGEKIAGTIIDGSGAGTVMNITADNVNVTGFTIRNSGKTVYDLPRNSGIKLNIVGNCSVYENLIIANAVGIEGRYCLNSAIRENVIMNNGNGIELSWARNNTLYENFLAYNTRAIFMECSMNSTLYKNDIYDNRIGLDMDEGWGYVLRNNTIVNNDWNFNVDSFGVTHFPNDIDTSNTINGKPIYYLLSRTGLLITPSTFPDIGYLALVDCFNITVRDLTMKNNGDGVLVVQTNNTRIQNLTSIDNRIGIELICSSENTIIGSTIDNSWMGIFISECSNNTIVENIISDSDYGIWALDPTYHRIFHNAFINDTWPIGTVCLSWCIGNVFDDGYPSGGNYWSDYTGVDSNCDGIGDIGNYQDRYPLMGIFHSFNTSLGKQITVVSNSSIEDFEYIEGDWTTWNRKIIMHVSNMTANQTVGFCQICIPHDLMLQGYTVLIDGAEPLYWNYALYDNGTHRWIYFTYERSTKEIVITQDFWSEIRFKGSVVTDEECNSFWCYGAYRCKVTVEEVLDDPSGLLLVNDTVYVAYCVQKFWKIGDDVECYGMYYKYGGPRGCIGYVNCKGDYYYIIPELPSSIILPLFMIATLLAVAAYRKKNVLTSSRDIH